MVAKMFLFPSRPGGSDKKTSKFGLKAIGGVFGGTQNNIISWIVKPLRILVARTGFAGW